MEKLNKTVLSSLTLIALLTTAACSSSNNGNTSPAGNNSASSAAPSDGSDKKYTISMMDMTYGKIPPSDGAGVKMINEKFNVDYKTTIVPYDGYLEKMSATIAGGDMPDILGIEEYVAAGSLQKWADQGAFLKLNDYIDKYPTLKMVPAEVWGAVTNKDGSIWGIPRYYPNTAAQNFAIRQDWLDKLGLKMPTSYDELAKVALAFTKDDPDGNGKDDTYGLVMSGGGYPNYAMGAYWDLNSWYHKDADGNFIPGYIGEGRKEAVKVFADLYKQGAITKGFGANATLDQGQADFYNGKAGIYITGIRGLDENLANSLLSVNPNAKLSAIPPFVAPDGSQGFMAQKGYYRITVLNAKLAGDEGKIDRILSMIDYGRTFVPVDQQTPDNENFDFRNGKNGVGYTYENGVVTLSQPDQGLMPASYLPDAVMWAPSVLDNKYSELQTNPLYKPLVKELEQQYQDFEQYADPSNSGFSATLNSGKGTDAMNKVTDTQVKMIMGDTPLSDWDKMVDEFMKSGGSDIIKEMNDSLKGKELIGYKNMSK
ncbi:Lipoprotein LipO precursor [compost metagenome]